VAVVLTLVQTKQIRINIHRPNNTKHSKYKYTYYQNTQPIVKTPTHYKTHTYTHPHITKPTHTHTHIHTHTYTHIHTHTYTHTYTHTHTMRNPNKENRNLASK